MAKKYITKRVNGHTFYFKDPEMIILHREDGPAVEQASGGKLWLQNSRFHRVDGPATENDNGEKSWFVNGEFIFALSSKEELVNRMK